MLRLSTDGCVSPSGTGQTCRLTVTPNRSLESNTEAHFNCFRLYKVHILPTLYPSSLVAVPLVALRSWSASLHRRPVNTLTWIWLILPHFSVIYIQLAYRWQCAPLIQLIRSQAFLTKSVLSKLIWPHLKCIGLLSYVHLCFLLTLEWFAIVFDNYTLQN